MTERAVRASALRNGIDCKTIESLYSSGQGSSFEVLENRSLMQRNASGIHERAQYILSCTML